MIQTHATGIGFSSYDTLSSTTTFNAKSRDAFISKTSPREQALDTPSCISVWKYLEAAGDGSTTDIIDVEKITEISIKDTCGKLIKTISTPPSKINLLGLTSGIVYRFVRNNRWNPTNYKSDKKIESCFFKRSINKRPLSC